MNAYTLHVIDGAHRVDAFVMAVSAIDQCNADRSPTTAPTTTGDSTSMASLAASNKGIRPDAWKVRCELYFFGDGVKSSEELRGVSLGFQLMLNSIIHCAARRMTVSDTVKMVTTIPE